MSEITGWINGNPLPDRPGWYDLRCIYAFVYRFWWTGQSWRRTKESRKRIPFGVKWGDKFRGLSASAKD